MVLQGLYDFFFLKKLSTAPKAGAVGSFDSLKTTRLFQATSKTMS